MIETQQKNRILALETTGEIASVCIADFDNNSQDTVRLIEKESTQMRNHLTELMPMIRDALNEADIKLSEIDAIAVSAGPGSFTGMRIGVSTARALAQVKEIPVIKVPTLETFIFASAGIVCPIFDARLSQLYAGVFEKENNPISKNILVPGGAYLPDDFFSDLTSIMKDSEQIITFFGDGIKAFRKEMEEWIQTSGASVKIDSETIQKAIYVAKWAFHFGKLSSYSSLEPIYIRKAEAQRRLDEGLLKPKA